MRIAKARFTTFTLEVVVYNAQQLCVHLNK